VATLKESRLKGKGQLVLDKPGKRVEQEDSPTHIGPDIQANITTESQSWDAFLKFRLVVL
jgi:hypothetical protein